MSGNEIDKFVLSNGLHNLSKSEELYMSRNEIDKIVLSNDFNSLEILDLSENKLNNAALSSLANLLSLKFLYLSSNRLKGVIHLRGKLASHFSLQFMIDNIFDIITVWSLNRSQ
ncbi:protein phosphatase 1 regulatory inhibitor subunit PPP1R7 homolog [Mangifera indica]|uniref:protein phosphatase 1 regulatory inhibitor subunit PPP1R7 homolog n=1 Tax=Mangifera indica TaxID=29780 RepID=UPI001CFABA77|nr:protein phosphatase 1 regulatory inhibitor subunit PPP1R7 homolog [Mangifera indica]